MHYRDGKGEVREELIKKTRPDDFKGEVDHIEQILNGGDRAGSPISIERGLDTMLVIAAVHISYQHKRSVGINYDRGYTSEAVELL